jgi:lipopolysaccharide export system ATP-binding protein
VLLDGHDVTDLPVYLRARLGIGYLPQERSVFRGLSVRDNVLTVIPGDDQLRRVMRGETLLHEFGLADLADRRASKLSGGQQRRLEVARSLATDPRYLLFDEPFTGIDPLTIEALHDILVRLRERGVGVVLTDHNVRETLSLCDRAYVLVRGRVLAHGAPSFLVNDEAVREHFLGDACQDMVG